LGNTEVFGSDQKEAVQVLLKTPGLNSSSFCERPLRLTGRERAKCRIASMNHDLNCSSPYRRAGNSHFGMSSVPPAPLTWTQAEIAALWIYKPPQRRYNTSAAASLAPGGDTSERTTFLSGFSVFRRRRHGVVPKPEEHRKAFTTILQLEVPCFE